jgi:hypothetical protein
MTVENRVDIVFTNETIQESNTALRSLKEAIKPYVVALTADQKKSMVVVGNRLFDFIERGVMLAEANPDLIPPYIKMVDVKKDVDAWRVMNPMIKDLEQQLSLLNDTAALCGNEAYSSILSFYHYIKQAAKDNVPGAKPIYDDLKKQFPSTVAKKNVEEPAVSQE